MKTYQIDLRLPEEDRWKHVIARELKNTRRLVKQFMSAVPVPDWTLEVFRGAYRLSGGLYDSEIAAWAEALKVTPGLLTAAQCSYELSMMGGYAGEIFGCTSAVVDHPKLGPTHIRYLDWDLPGISKATALFTFHGGEHEFQVVGIAGFVGALSGWVPGEYSITINQAPPSQRPGFDMGPAFLLREVLTDCRRYADAVYALERTPISTPVFFTVCGKKQACVIERLRGKYATRYLRKGAPLVVTNHHVVKDWCDERCYADDELQDDSETRFRMTLDALRKPAGTLAGLVRQLGKFPIKSEITVQRMAFNPRGRRIFVA